jgi:hypothetical protein
MRKPLLLALAAAAALSVVPDLAQAQWVEGGYVVRHVEGPRCRVFREWRHGELRIIKTCRPSYGRWGGPRGYYGFAPGYHRGWDERRWHERRWHERRWHGDWD